MDKYNICASRTSFLGDLVEALKHLFLGIYEETEVLVSVDAVDFSKPRKTNSS